MRPRGGWKRLGGVAVKSTGAGWGLVKFIWRLGEKSDKPKELSPTRYDLRAFPQIIRNYKQLPDGNPRRRQWAVDRPDGQRMLYVDKLFDEIGKRHMVTIHVLKDKNSKPLSEEIKANPPGSDERAFQVPLADTTGVPFPQHSQGHSGSASFHIESLPHLGKDERQRLSRDIVDRQRQLTADPEGFADRCRGYARTKGYEQSLMPGAATQEVEKACQAAMRRLDQENTAKRLDENALAELKKADAALKQKKEARRSIEPVHHCAVLDN